jgi:hypothetical protein
LNAAPLFQIIAKSLKSELINIALQSSISFSEHEADERSETHRYELKLRHLKIKKISIFNGQEEANEFYEDITALDYGGYIF